MLDLLASHTSSARVAIASFQGHCETLGVSREQPGRGVERCEVFKWGSPLPLSSSLLATEGGWSSADCDIFKQCSSVFEAWTISLIGRGVAWHLPPPLFDYRVSTPQLSSQQKNLISLNFLFYYSQAGSGDCIRRGGAAARAWPHRGLGTL